MVKPIRAHIMLGDYAAVFDGKLTIVGAGWNFTGPDPTPSAIGLMFHVPWDQTNRRHTWSLVLRDGDGNVLTDDAGNALQLGGTFEAGRPPGHPAGTSIPMAQAINVGPLPLVPGSRYVWELTIDDEGDEEWTAAFSVRPRPGPTRIAS
ncbi:MAG: DUF6941 family protein [Gammaproteobacteria bacterium]